MDVRMLGLGDLLIPTLPHRLHASSDELDRSSTPTRAYFGDARAMAATPADVKDLPSSYAFVVDMPGVGSGDVKVQIEDDHVLVVSGERRRDEEEIEGGGKYLRMERRMGKFMRKFALPEDAEVEKVTAVCRDGVLTVTVMKKPPPETKKTKTVQIKVA